MVDTVKEMDEIKARIANPSTFAKMYGTDDQKQLDMLQKRLQLLKEMQVQQIGLIDNAANYDARDIRARQKPDAPLLPPKGAGGADDPAKARMEQALKELDAYAAREKLILSARDEFLKVYYAQGYLSVKQYYDGLQTALLDNLSLEESTYTKELAVIDKYIAGLDKKKGAEKAAAEAMAQRAGIEEKLFKVRFEASTKSGIISLEGEEATRQYQGSLEAINAELLALQGNTAAAAAITRAFAEVIPRRQMSADGARGAAGIAQLNQRDRLLGITDKLTEATSHYSDAVQQLGINQSLVDLQFQSGSITELESYAKKADAARAMIPLLTAEAASYEAIGAGIAKAGGDPTKFVLAAEGMRLEIAKLAVDADALSKKFTDIFEGAFATFLTDIVSRTKSVKQAFLDMGKSIEQQISSIAAKNVAEQLFGKTGMLGGTGDFFAKMFGDKGAGSSGAGAALTSLSTSAAAATTAIQTDVTAYLAVATAAQAAATALASVASSSAVGGAGSLLSGSGGGWTSGFDLAGAAVGTPFVQQDMIAMVHKGEAIIPASMNRAGASRAGGHTINITNNISGDTSTASAAQIARETALAVRLATRKAGG
jgi:hypothetical protein